ncbi:MAG: PDZ domain-containing protein, partial [Nitrososphaera sp.]
MNGTSYFLPSDQSNNTTGIAYDNRISPPAGLLQIPYTGLVRNQITPEIASMLGLNGSTFGMIVSEVMPDSPAEEAGFHAGNITRSVSGNIIRLGGDMILAIDGNTSFVRSNDAYLHYLQNVKKVGENLTFSVLRDGDVKEISLTIGA